MLLVEHTLKKSRNDYSSRSEREDKYGDSNRGSRYDRDYDRDRSRDGENGSHYRRGGLTSRLDKEKYMKNGLCF